MIKLYKRAMEGVKHFTFWDRTVLKIYLVVFGIFLATIIPGLTNLARWIYLIIIIPCAIYISTRIFKKR